VIKKIIRITLVVLLIILVIIQFVRPEKNNYPVLAAKMISAKFPIPDSVHNLLKVSCYDCHSNHTNYPWYNNFQPVMWFLTDHINEGKRNLNFDEFAGYSISKQYKRLKDIGGEVKKGDMPLESYTLIHRDAVLNATQKGLIISWVNENRHLMEGQYPADSLRSKPKK
jgi:hypothetical protein